MAKFTFRGTKRALPRSTRRALKLSRAALSVEALAHALWPAFAVVCLVLALAVFGAFEPLTGGALLGAQLSALAALLVALGWGAWRLRAWPSSHDAALRLDADDPGRPLAALEDNLAGEPSDPRTRAIWRVHQARAAAAAARRRARAPETELARRDGWALRLFAPILLIAALIGSGPDWQSRVASLFDLDRSAAGTTQTFARAPGAEGWIAPPPYLGGDVLYLDRAADGATPAPIEVAEGSEIVIRVTDFAGEPSLDGAGLAGFEGFTAFGGGLHEARAVLRSSGPIEVAAGDDRLARWQFTVIEDETPTIEREGLPTVSGTRALEVAFKAADDHGIVAAWGEIVPEGGLEPGRGLIEEPIAFALPLPLSGDATEVEDRAIEDLTAHPWAGAEVEIVLYAEDGAAQVGSSGTLVFTLPERRWSNPLAHALVENRRLLALDFGDADFVLETLQAVTRLPDEVFEDNGGAYLTVRSAIRRLASAIVRDRVPDEAQEITDLLWQAALSLEDGDLSDALERLRAAEQALRDALANGSEEDIRRAMEDLRAAMNDYLRQLAEQAQQNPQTGQQQQQSGQQLSQQDLQEMLDEIMRNAEGGLRDQAQDMLSELSRMLENLQAGQQQAGQQPGQGQGGQSLQELQEMIQRQRDLADQTFDELRQQRRGNQMGEGQQGQQSPGQQPGQQGQPGQGQNGDQQGQGQAQSGRGQPGGDLASEQEALRRALDELMSRLPGGADGEAAEEMRRALEEAGRAMGEATDDLEQGSAGDAVQDQMEALDRLNEGANALAQQVQEGQGQQEAQGQGREGETESESRAETDPFDRPSGPYGATDGRDTGVPDRSALDRAREVLEELRRRAAEPGRQRLELDYIDRLLDQF